MNNLAKLITAGVLIGSIGTGIAINVPWHQGRADFTYATCAQWKDPNSIPRYTRTDACVSTSTKNGITTTQLTPLYIHN